MSIATLILGESGTGKSTSLRNFDPKKTLLIQSIHKPLPSHPKGWQAKAVTSSTLIMPNNYEKLWRVHRKILS